MGLAQMRTGFLGGQVEVRRRAALLQRLAQLEAQEIPSLPFMRISRRGPSVCFSCGSLTRSSPTA
jgi:hypothetical protein